MNFKGIVSRILARQLYNGGEKVKDIAKTMGVSCSTVRRWLGVTEPRWR